MKNNNAKHTFQAILQSTEKGIDAVFVTIPFDVEATYGTKGQVKVNATFDGHPYRGVIANMGNGHCIGVRKDIRAAIRKSVGDIVKVTIEQDLKERTIEIPAELQDVLTRNSSAKKFFETLSYTNRKEYVLWITSAKKPETKEKRLKEITQKLSQHKKNPSEK